MNTRIIWKKIYITITLCFVITSCKRDTSALLGSTHTPEELREYYKSRIRREYVLSHSSSSPKQALEKFLREIAERKESPNSLCSEEETKDVLLPNTFDSGTITSNMEPEAAWNLIRMRREQGLITLQNKISKNSSPGVLGELHYSVKQYNSINGYIIKEIKIKNNNQSLSIDEVKLIIEHRGQFKVCIVAN